MNSDRKIFSWFEVFKYLAPYKLMIAGVLFSLVITSSSVLLVGKGIQFFIDHGLAKGSANGLNTGMLFLMGLVLSLAIFTFLRFYLVTLVGERMVRDMRADIYNKMLSLSPGYYENKKTGDVLTTLSSDTTVLLNVMSSSLSFALRNLVMMIGGFVMLTIMNLKLTIMISGLIPIVLVPIILLGKKLRTLSRQSQNKLADITSVSEETLYAIKTIQSYSREIFQSERFAEQLQNYIYVIKNRVSIRATLTASIIGLVFGGVVLVLWYGAHQVLQNKISAGELTAFVYLAVITAASVGGIVEVYSELQKALGSLDRIFAFLRTESEIKNHIKPLKIPHKKQLHLEFKNVSFSYPSAPERTILDNLSFDILPGKINAIVGKSGAGKSTIFTLIERFYDVNLGSILINGIDIRKITLSDLRSTFAYVSQEPIVFSSTVYENILYGNLNATKEEVYEAAKAARAFNFIERMPEGFNSFIGEKGVRISGGQKQRIAIARAILSNPKILLLDEATSSLDSENEDLVQTALRNLMKDRTTIVIAHRLATIMDADQILVLQQGKIVDKGTHKSLIKKDGLYKKLINLQFKKPKGA